VAALVKFFAQPSQVVPVGSHSSKVGASYVTETLERVVQAPPQQPFPASCRVALPDPAPRQQPDVVEMAAQLLADEKEEEEADAAAAAAIAAAGPAGKQTRRHRPRFETMQRRLLKAFLKTQMADMLLALSTQRKSDQHKLSALQLRESQLQQQVAQLEQQILQLQQ
jgi:hypothetical protein